MADVIDSITSFNVSGAFKDFIGAAGVYLLYGIIGCAVVGYIYYWLRNRQIYKFRAVVKKRRGNSAPEKAVYPAGYVTVNNFNTFRIKIGRFKHKDLDKLPDTRYLDGINFHFQVKDPETWVQTRIIDLERKVIKRKMRLLTDFGGFKAGQEGMQFQDIAQQMVDAGVAEYSDDGQVEEVEVTDEVYEPIPSDTKAITVMKLQNAANALGLNANKQIAIFTVGIIVLAICFIVGYYFLTKGPG